MDEWSWLNWIVDPRDNVVMVAASVVVVFVIFGVCTRLGRLRSLSQMTGFDFGVNVAVGSILAAAVLSPDPSWLRTTVALITLFAMQAVYSVARRKMDGLNNPSSQNPTLVWAHGEFYQPGLVSSLFTQSDVYQAMRMAKARNLDEVEFVVAEPTGDLNVFMKCESERVSDELFHNVTGRETLEKS